MQETRQYTTNVINEYLSGQITFKKVEYLLKKESVKLKAFIRGKAQIKVHCVIDNKNELLTF